MPLRPFAGVCVTTSSAVDLTFTLGAFPVQHQWTFLCVPDLPFDFILGRDWKTAAGVCVDELCLQLTVRAGTSLPTCAVHIAAAVPTVMVSRMPSVPLMDADTVPVVATDAVAFSANCLRYRCGRDDL